MEGHAHSVIEWCASARAVVLFCEVLHVCYGDADTACLHSAHSITFEGDDAHVVFLFRVLFLFATDSAEDFVDAAKCGFVDGRHAPAFVQNDNVVDFHFALCVLVYGSKGMALRAG